MVCHCRVFIKTEFLFFNQNLEMKLNLIWCLYLIQGIVPPPHPPPKKKNLCKPMEFIYLFISLNLLFSLQGLQRIYTQHKIKLSKVWDVWKLHSLLCKYIYKVFFQLLLIKMINQIFPACGKTLMFCIFLKIDHIFLSRVCSETTGGLPGLYHDRSTMMYLWSLTAFQFRIITKENVLVCSI